LLLKAWRILRHRKTVACYLFDSFKLYAFEKASAHNNGVSCFCGVSGHFPGRAGGGNNFSVVALQHKNAENCRPVCGFSWPFARLSSIFGTSAFLALGFPMSHYLFLLIGAVLVNNVVLVKILGLCPFMGVSKKLDTAYGMGAATTFVLTLATGASFVIDHYLLMPYGLGYLRTIAFIVTIAGIVQLTEMVIAKASPVLQQVLGIYLPLITTNCAVLGVPLINVSHGYGFVESLLFGFGSAVGFTLVLILFAGMRERFEAGDVPAPFKGVAIAMVTAGLMSLAFMGFSGLDRY
jgi:electron transport complex protein RnfA